MSRRHHSNAWRREAQPSRSVDALIYGRLTVSDCLHCDINELAGVPQHVAPDLIILANGRGRLFWDSRSA